MDPRPGRVYNTIGNPHKYNFMRLQEFRKHPVFWNFRFKAMLPGFFEGLGLAVIVITCQLVVKVLTKSNKQDHGH